MKQKRSFLWAAPLVALLLATGCNDDDDKITPPDDDEFDFASEPASAYTRVDRMGMPAVATAVISSSRKNEYNAADPTDDAAGDFVADITNNVGAIHAALDDDLAKAGLTPCVTGDCVGQAAPIVVPDVLRINPSADAGFPNGRRLQDQVIDVTLAVVLLDLDAGGQSATTLADIPLNPSENDAEFSSTFPYLAAPGSGGSPSPFQFADEAASAYTRVDRMGMPAIATAVIPSGRKDEYNAADPTDDEAGDFVSSIVASVEALHGALDDDLTGAGLTACASGDCIDQAAPLVVPDVLRLNPSTAAGFPNGRRVQDPVIDITLAVILLDLDAGGQSATTLADLPLNPPANDVAFRSSFPYLGSPQQ